MHYGRDEHANGEAKVMEHGTRWLKRDAEKQQEVLNSNYFLIDCKKKGKLIHKLKSLFFNEVYLAWNK